MASATTENENKPVIVVGLDPSAYSMDALEWTLDHFFKPFDPNNPPYRLVVVHAKRTSTLVLADNEAGLSFLRDRHVGYFEEVLRPKMEAHYKRVASELTTKARDLYSRKSVQGAVINVVEGRPRSVLVEAVEKNHASILVVGCHGRSVELARARRDDYMPVTLGRVSDECVDRAHCNVIVVRNAESTSTPTALPILHN